jgi:hypothetical protein
MIRRTDLIALDVGGALVLTMLGATGGAIAAAKIGSKEIADNSIRSRDVRDGSLELRDLNAGTQAALSSAPGPQGPPGGGGSGRRGRRRRRRPGRTLRRGDRLDPGQQRPATGGTLMNFYGSGFGTYFFTTARDTYSAEATKVLQPGTYNVGMCVRNNGSSTINNNNYVNGWVMVTA